MIILLLLGSYDLDTKNLMEGVKKEIAEKFGGEGVYIYLLDELDVYLSEKFYIISEKWKEDKISIYIFSLKGEEIEAYDIKAPSHSFEEAIKRFLKEKYNIEKLKKETIFDKLEILSHIAKVIILIREKEETRGGEIAELIFLILSNFSSKLCVFKREGIELSDMIKEFLDYSNVVLRTYKNQEELQKEVLRYIWYRLKENIDQPISKQP
jgi:hypothetical protein